MTTVSEEQIPFENFQTGENMLLAERRAPDTLGGRIVIVPYQHIGSFKIVDVIQGKSLEEMGFRGALPKKASARSTKPIPLATAPAGEVVPSSSSPAAG